MTGSLRASLDERDAPYGAVGLVVVGVLGVAGVLLAWRHGAGATAIVVAVVLATAAGLGIVQLPPRWVGPVWLLTLVAGIVAPRWTGQPVAYPWVAFLFVGGATGQQLRHHRQERRRARAGLPPTSRRRAPVPGPAQLRVVRDDGADQVETVDAPAADVREILHALDGRTRTAFSVLRGTARLDVGGDASGAMVVYQCDDVVAEGLPAWSVVTSADDPWSSAEVDLRLVGVDAHLPAGGLTTLEPASAALDAFLATSGRAPGLPWRTGPDVDDLRAIFEALA